MKLKLYEWSERIIIGINWFYLLCLILFIYLFIIITIKENININKIFTK